MNIIQNNVKPTEKKKNKIVKFYNQKSKNIIDIKNDQELVEIYKGYPLLATEKQLQEWLNGNPKHLSEYCILINKQYDRCCPDLSCCYPNIAWPYKTKLNFINNSKFRREILLEFGSYIDIVSKVYMEMEFLNKNNIKYLN